MSSETTFKSVQDEASKSLVNVTRTAGQLAGEDLGFFRASNPVGAKQLEIQNARLLGLAKRLVQSATTGTAVPPPSLKDAEALDDNWQGIVEVIDSLLEKADIALDEYTGVIKKVTTDQETQMPSRIRDAQRPSHAAMGMPKPQLLFNNTPTNASTTAWKPRLRSKPNAKVPLDLAKKPTTGNVTLEE